MRVDDFDYELLPELIAQSPLPERDASRMMIVDRASGTFADRSFRELPQILRPGDLLVFNNTRVFPARLLGRRRGTRAQAIGRHNPRRREYLTTEIEVFLLRQEGDKEWQALVRPGRKVRVGEMIDFGHGELAAEVVGRAEYGRRRLRLWASHGTVEETIDRLGHTPLPPYIQRPDTSSDRLAYQTVYAKVRGAVAAPTAGLHFTRGVLDEFTPRGIETCEITLHVGVGTFRPVKVERAEDHRMEPEWFEIPREAAAALNRARHDGRRIVAVGTTSVRALEHAALQGAEIQGGCGETNLFILPGFEFRLARAVLTNFHLPRSTLLMLVSAFAGRDLIRRAYEHAIQERYRFYSYGDCMLIL